MAGQALCNNFLSILFVHGIQKCTSISSRKEKKRFPLDYKISSCIDIHEHLQSCLPTIAICKLTDVNVHAFLLADDIHVLEHIFI